MLSRLFVILLFVPFLLWVFLKGDILFLIFTIVIIGASLYEFYKKIWAECDKLITDAAKKQEIGGKKQ